MNNANIEFMSVLVDSLDRCQKMLDEKNKFKQLFESGTGTFSEINLAILELGSYWVFDRMIRNLEAIDIQELGMESRQMVPKLSGTGFTVVKRYSENIQSKQDKFGKLVKLYKYAHDKNWAPLLSLDLYIKDLFLDIAKDIHETPIEDVVAQLENVLELFYGYELQSQQESIALDHTVQRLIGS